MCSPDEGPRRTETSQFFIKSLELKSPVYFLNIYIYIYAQIFKHNVIDSGNTMRTNNDNRITFLAVTIGWCGCRSSTANG